MPQDETYTPSHKVSYKSGAILCDSTKKCPVKWLLKITENVADICVPESKKNCWIYLSEFGVLFFVIIWLLVCGKWEW